MDWLAEALHTNGRPKDALPVYEAFLSLRRRHWPHDDKKILDAQSDLAICLYGLERLDEALVLEREIYARRVATLGVSHEKTISAGLSLVNTLVRLDFYDEAAPFVRDQLLPVARQSLGADHDVTLKLKQNLAAITFMKPGYTRDDLRIELTDPCAALTLISHPGDDLLESVTILKDVVRRRRRVFGPAHPDTIWAVDALSKMREALSNA